jgi:hypothetical protein
MAIMGTLGFPSGKDMSEMFGYVTPEDQAGWEKQREASKAAQVAKPGTAKEMANKSIAPALDMAKRGVQAQLHGAQMESQRGDQAKTRTRVTRETVTEQSRNVDASDDSGPEF